MIKVNGVLLPLVVVDPGHSGGSVPGTRDYGAQAHGESEQAINFTIASMIREQFGRNSQTVTLTRRDPFEVVGLNDRCAIANRAKADFFLSVHCNADFKDDPENLSETATGYPQEIEPASLGIETFYYPGSDVGRKCAEKIQKMLVDVTGSRDRGAKESKFRVLRNTKMPAVLVEVGFLTSNVEVQMLKSTMYQRMISNALARGIVEATKIIGIKPLFSA